MAPPSQLLALVSGCRDLRTLYLFHPESGCGLGSETQRKVLQAAAISCPQLTRLEVFTAAFTLAGEF
jgi:hypothetical protein